MGEVTKNNITINIDLISIVFACFNSPPVEIIFP